MTTQELLQKAKAAAPALLVTDTQQKNRALLAMAEISGDERYFDFSRRFIDAFVGEDGAIRTYMPEKHTLDDINEGRVLFPLYERTGLQKYRLAADRLKAALLILESLEANEIVGEIASVDVTSLFNMELMYGQRYQVKLGDTSQMDKKISQMKQSVAQLNEYQSGILDVSYITWPDGPFYTPLA